MRYALVIDKDITYEYRFSTFEEADGYVRSFYPEPTWEHVYPYIWLEKSQPLAIVELPYDLHGEQK